MVQTLNLSLDGNRQWQCHFKVKDTQSTHTHTYTLERQWTRRGLWNRVSQTLFYWFLSEVPWRAVTVSGNTHTTSFLLSVGVQQKLIENKWKLTLARTHWGQRQKEQKKEKIDKLKTEREKIIFVITNIISVAVIIPFKKIKHTKSKFDKHEIPNYTLWEWREEQRKWKEAWRWKKMTD